MCDGTAILPSADDFARNVEIGARQNAFNFITLKINNDETQTEQGGSRAGQLRDPRERKSGVQRQAWWIYVVVEQAWNCANLAHPSRNTVI